MCTQLKRCRPWVCRSWWYVPARSRARVGNHGVVLRAAEAGLGQPEQRDERAAVAEDDRHAQGHAAGAGQVRREQGVLPRLRHRDREALAELAGGLVLRAVVGVPVDRRRGRVHPQRRRVLARADRLGEFERGVDPERMISARFRRPYRQFTLLPAMFTDEGRAVDEFADPQGVAPDGVPGAADRHDLVPLIAERLLEVPSDEAARSATTTVVAPPSASPSSTRIGHDAYRNAPSYRYSVPPPPRAPGTRAARSAFVIESFVSITAAQSGPAGAPASQRTERHARGDQAQGARVRSERVDLRPSRALTRRGDPGGRRVPRVRR